MLFVSPCGEPFRSRFGEPYPVAAWFAQADSNDDGRLTRSEFVDDAMRFFAVLDRNQNGRVDPEEVAYYEQRIAPEILARRMGAAASPISRAAYEVLDQMGGMGGGGMGGGGMGGGPGGGMRGTPGDGDGPSSGPRRPPGPTMDGAAPYGLLGEPEPVTASDLSFSGRISADDFNRRARQRFDLLDPDQKGYLELATLPHTMMQDMMDPGGPHGPKGRRPRPPHD